MIAGIFHEGSGVGNQLHRYVMTRVLAIDNGYQFGMCFPEYFKAAHFMNIDMGVPVKDLRYSYVEKSEKNEFGDDVRDYDLEVMDNRVRDYTMIDGEFQGEKYYKHRLGDIKKWLKVKPLAMPDNVCVINFRGGEYVGVPGLFLPQSYWNEAIALMRKMYPYIVFEVHTDDAVTAKKFFPDFPCIHNVGLNWRAIRYAKHLIISNSSFAILPALIGDAKEVIAPRYWAGYNKGFWQQKQNQYERFTYI